MNNPFYHWLEKPINYRNYLPNLLVFLGLNGKGIEIGVAKGEYSEIILCHSNLEVLYSVDSWEHYPQEVYDDVANISQEEHSCNKKITEDRLNKFGDRSKILHMTSKKASKLFRNRELDFVYIDANHLYEAVKEDLGLWYPKVKERGIIAGHDYLDMITAAEGNFGVKPAVDELVKKYNQKLFVTNESWPTWYLIKYT